MKKKIEPTEHSFLLTDEQKAIFDWLNSVTFQRSRFGGLDEVDVWRKIETLNTLYEKAFAAERSKYTTLIRAMQMQLDAAKGRGGRNGE